MYKPSAQRELTGSMVRRYRERAGLSIDDAASILGCDRSKVSRIETGMRGFRPAELRVLLAALGVDAGTQELLAAISGWREVPGWWQGFLAHLPSAYLDFVIPETFASRSLIYAPLHVPEPLCTRRYSQAMVASDPGIGEDAEDRVVEAMQQRRRVVVDERRTELDVVIGEAALRQQAGGEAALRQQLIHLAELTGTDYPHITIRVLPFEASCLAAGGFSLLTFEEIPSLHIAHLAGPAGGLCLHDPAITAGYVQAIETLTAHALDPSRSARKLVTMANMKAASR
jgi:transcriptional regulator with XRE-family HTH domain